MEIAKQQDAFQEDIHSILDVLDLGTHARPVSPHQVVADEILPAIRELRNITRDFVAAYTTKGVDGFERLDETYFRALALPSVDVLCPKNLTS